MTMQAIRTTSAAVIGRPAKNVPEAWALDHVAGYLIAND
jgi:2-keto-4-pentenoate hydratase/2-oxohepta-3-ene-1,7-dioic acid hydratase in catechol pathway